MGRTQQTYRVRLLVIRDRMMSLIKSRTYREKYKKLWIASHQLSAPSSTFPWPDTHAVATYCMLLELMKKINQLEKRIIE